MAIVVLQDVLKINYKSEKSNVTDLGIKADGSKIPK